MLSENFHPDTKNNLAHQNLKMFKILFKEGNICLIKTLIILLEME